MAVISRIKPGQTLYSLTRQKMGSTTVSHVAVHPVYVREVDPEGRFVLASWNGNPPRKFFVREVKRWRVKKPEPKGTIFGMPTY